MKRAITPSQKRTLFSLTKKEAKKLRKHATPEELGNLMISELDASSYSKCIYGQMTGNCNSWRANQLIIQCAERVYNSINGYDDDINNLNGAPREVAYDERTEEYFSPIEMFIYFTNNDNKRSLVNYLKGKSDELKFI